MSNFDILNDDTQTFEGKPLVRFFRMRKWAILTSLTLILISQNWLDIEAVKGSLKMSELPSEIFHKSVWLIAVYLFIQLAFLLLQLATSYRDNLQNRVLLSLKSQIDKVTEIINKLTENLRELENQIQKELNTQISQEYEMMQPEIVSLQIKICRQEDEKRKLLSGNNITGKIILFTELTLDIMRILPTMAILLIAITFNNPF